MKKVLWISTALLLTLSGSVPAKTYTLNECIQMALEKDPSLVKFHNAVKTAKAGVWQAAGGFLPSVGVSYSSIELSSGPESPRLTEYTFFNDSTGQMETWLVNAANTKSTLQKYYSAGIVIDQVLFDGFNNVWSYLGSRASKRQAENNYASGKSNLIFLIKYDYYLVLKARKDLEVARDAVKRSEELLKLFEEKYELGSASLSEVLKQKVQYGNDQLTLVRAEKVFEVNMDNLALDIGLDPQTDFSIADIDLRQEPVGDLDELIKEAGVWHPVILAAKAGIDAAKYNVRSALAGYLPRLTLNYWYGWNKDYFSDIVKFGPLDHTGRLGLTLTYNIFDGFTRERNMSLAKAGRNNSKASYLYARNEIVKDIRDAYLGIKLAEETLKVTEETEQAASEDMDLVQAKYNLGAAALWELLDAQVSLKSASFEKVKAEFDYNLALAKLKNAMGE